ncbi:MAG TPA: MBL fold metallo-hydrolase [Pirellulales bacterium]|jgi:competence protein ComEC|nr:MBL fold metallo-hydrolase [Pirellulales bacterium]
MPRLPRLARTACFAFLLLLAADLPADEKPAGKLIVTCLQIPDRPGGVGLAIVLQTPSGKTYLYDTGVGYPEGAGWAHNHNTGRDVIAPFLARHHIREIDGVAISHAHYDHFGGLLWLVDHMPVHKLYDSGYTFRGESAPNYTIELNDYENLRKRFADRPGEYEAVRQGDRLQWDDALEVEAISPAKDFFTEPHPERRPKNDPPAHYLVNANSLGLRIRHGGIVFLLPGDIQSEDQLQSLLPAVPAEKLRCHVLFAPGHGIHSVPEFAMATRPEVTVASIHARWGRGSPAPRVFGQVGSKVLITGIDGGVQFISDGKTYTTTLLPAEKPEPPVVKP